MRQDRAKLPRRKHREEHSKLQAIVEMESAALMAENIQQ